MNTLILDASEGISGDLFVASLLDLGADRDGLLETLRCLGVDGWSVEITPYENRGIMTTRFTVHAEEGHVHRHYSDIREILSRLADDSVRALAEKIFRIVAEAESFCHDVPIASVHFHEVGALDSIIDITAAAYAVCDLSIEECVIRTLCEGTGTVMTAHGLLTVPVPATARIAETWSLPLTKTDLPGERITPTGAAIAAALAGRNVSPENSGSPARGIGREISEDAGPLPKTGPVIRKTGYASGHRVYGGQVSLLCAHLAEL